jgi:hypothetical protein
LHFFRAAVPFPFRRGVFWAGADPQAAAKELAADNDPRLPRSRRFAYNPAWALYLNLPSASEDL